MEVFFYWMGVLRYLGFALGGFVLGGVLFSYHLPLLLKGVDVREVSSDHNPGTVNAFKYAGIPVGILCLICDLCKGFFPVFFAMRHLDPFRPWFALVLCAPVLGHAMAPLYHHRGGKAIAASFGVFLGLLPVSFLVFILAALYIFFSVVWIIRPHERRTVVTFGLLSLSSALGAFLTGRWSFCLGTVLVSTVVIGKNYHDARIAFQSAPESDPQVSKQNS